MVTVDKHDLALLTELQRDAKLTNSALGEKIHLSTSQVSRRVQRLEDTKVISHYTAILDHDVVGLSVTAFTSVILGLHGEAHREAFERAVSDMPEVLECLSVSGEADYVLRVVAPDLASFSDFMTKRLLRLPGVINVKSNIALKRVKHTHILPLDHVTQPVKASRRLIFSS